MQNGESFKIAKNRKIGPVFPKQPVFNIWQKKFNKSQADILVFFVPLVYYAFSLVYQSFSLVFPFSTYGHKDIDHYFKV